MAETILILVRQPLSLSDTFPPKGEKQSEEQLTTADQFIYSDKCLFWKKTEFPPQAKIVKQQIKIMRGVFKINCAIRDEFRNILLKSTSTQCPKSGFVIYLSASRILELSFQPLFYRRNKLVVFIYFLYFQYVIFIKSNSHLRDFLAIYLVCTFFSLQNISSVRKKRIPEQLVPRHNELATKRKFGNRKELFRFKC